jgi:hypothetical protein
MTNAIKTLLQMQNGFLQLESTLEDRLNSDVYVRILEDVMMPLVSRIFPNFNFIFQQDNCSMHSAHRVAEW